MKLVLRLAVVGALCLTALLASAAQAQAPAMPAAADLGAAWHEAPDATSLEALPAQPAQVLATGLASWYSPRLHGRKTASGERFDAQGLTAAHRSLPLGTLIEVHNPANGRRVTVRVNDRGPHVRGVLLDLSPRAAQRLGLLRAGRAQVQISRVADPAS